jgi:hypothetical protein
MESVQGYCLDCRVLESREVYGPSETDGPIFI